MFFDGGNLRWNQLLFEGGTVKNGVEAEDCIVEIDTDSQSDASISGRNARPRSKSSIASLIWSNR